MNRISDSVTMSDAAGCTHSGNLWIASDAPYSAVEAAVGISDDGRLLATSSGMALLDWLLTDVAIETEDGITTFRRGDDALVFAPDDKDAWDDQLAAYRLRSRLVTSSLAVGGDIATSSHLVPRQPTAERYDRGEGIPPIHVVQSTSVATPRRVTHWLHLLLTVVTFGFWLPIWAGVAIYTGVVNSRSMRPARQMPPIRRPIAAPVPVRKDPEAVRASNRRLARNLAIGAAVIVLLGTALSLASGGESANASVAASPGTTVAPSQTTTTSPPKPPAAVAVPSTTTTVPASVEGSRAILAGTSGMLRTILEDLMDSTSCEELTFDLKFATDNFSFDQRQSDRIVRAVDYAQKYGISGASCRGLDPYLNRLAG